MIERLVLKNHLSFENCSLSFTEGLMLFTGPSGAGKSVFMQGLLSLFGHTEMVADRIECTLSYPLDLEPFGFENDEILIFKAIKSKTVRYFINDQSVSKKAMADISRTFLHYLSLKEAPEFENKALLELLDGVCASKEPLHVTRVEEFALLYDAYKALQEAYDRLEKEENSIEELKEFARFEIAKIEEVSPKIGEDEALLSFKKSLSKKEKLEHALKEASVIFTLEASVHEALRLMEISSDFFDEAMNQVRIHFEKERERLDELEEIDMEAMLDRIEKIAMLKKKYGSIEEALAHLKRRREELAHYESIAFEKEHLLKAVKLKKIAVEQEANRLSSTRKAYLETLEKSINAHLEALYMPRVSLSIEETLMHERGWDVLKVHLGSVDLKKISSGEYNRLRLAFLASRNDVLLSSGGVLVLDEIDANLSGKESMSVANVLKILSEKYQIFAISHQPQLSSKANSHFLVTKDSMQGGHVKLLDDNERIFELARMVSGEKVSEEALEFAKTLLKSRDL